ncbi:tetratricopeptide repeat-containing protein, putative [Babesia ovis]|uniref:Tetratricopeptide repeat-containing protein, putative n=1 Tax=Babesia ovis TaxID=5869 RepID=A0A9W5WU23_BABOV|nr:tetratricopeptide repeat-containing protein, putative [Babesia ovis]
MASSWPGTSFEAPTDPDSKGLSRLRRFQQVALQRLEELYSRNAFEELGRFAEQNINSLDQINGGNYARCARSLLGNSSDTAEDARLILNLSDSNIAHRLMADGDFLCMLVFTQSIKIYQYDYSNNSDVDQLLLSYDMYTTLYLAMIDSLIQYEDWEHGFDILMQLGAVLHLLRIDLGKVLQSLNDPSQTSCFRKSLLNNIISQRGIRVDNGLDVDHDRAIVVRVVEMFTQEMQLEIWSRVVILWLRDSSLHNILETLQTLPLHLRSKLYRNAKSSVLQGTKSRKKSLFIRHDSIDVSPTLCTNGTFCRNRGYSEGRCAYRWSNIRYRRVFAYLLSVNTCYRRYALEGWLMLAQISMDVDEEFGSSLYFMMYMVMRIISSNTTVPRQATRNRFGNRKSVSCNNKGQSKLLDKQYMIMNYAWSQHSANQKVRCVMSDVDLIWLRQNWRWGHLKLKDKPLLYGLERYSGYDRTQLEFMVMVDVDHAVLYSAPDIEIMAFAQCSMVDDNINVSLEISRNDLGLLKSKVEDGCVDSIHLEDVVMGDHSVEVAIDFTPLCHLLASRNKMGNNKKSSMEEYRKLSKMMLAKEPNLEVQTLIRGYEPMVLLALVAFCISVDREYTVLHFLQSLEYLNYKDTLRKKGKMFLRQVLPWVPVRKSVETNRMLGFQKRIRNTFSYHAQKAYLKATGIDHLSKTGFDKTFARFISNTKQSSTLAKDHVSLTSGSEMPAQLKRKIRFQFSLLRRYRTVDRSERSIRSLYTSRPYVYNHGIRYMPFCNACTNGYRNSKIRQNPLTTSDGFTRSDVSELYEDHASPLSGNIAYMCSFCQIDRMILLINWISHFIFTSGVWLHKQNSSVLLPKSFSSRSRKQGNRGSGTTPMLYLQSTHEALSLGARGRKMLGYVSELHVSEPKPKGEIDPFSSSLILLNEIIESAMLLQMATYFHEQQYDHLLFRLALLQVLQGRWNLCLSLLKQLQGDTCQYNTPFGRTSVPISEVQPRLTNIEAKFVSYLSAKILIELVREPHLAIEQLSVEMYDVTESDGVKSGSYPKKQRNQSQPDPKQVSVSNNSRRMSTKSMLLLGAAYLKLGYLEVDPSSSSLSDIIDDCLHVEDSQLGTVCIVECLDNRSDENNIGDSADKSDISCGRGRVAKATEYILKSLSLDPLCYRAWIYLAHCGMVSHDYEFAYACCNRSIECYDSCLAAWLTMAVVLSSRARSCAPIRVKRGMWEKYFELCGSSESNNGGTSETKVVAYPVPYDPVFPTFAINELELSDHTTKSIGGDLTLCLDVLVKSARFGSAYSYAGALQVVCRTSDEMVDSFPWEISTCSPRSSLIVPRKLLLVLLASVDFASKKGTSIRPEDMNKDNIYRIHMYIKSLVATAVSQKLFISCIPFLRSLCVMFSLDVIADLRSGLIEKCGESNKGYMEEEVYGWIVFLEILSQHGHASTAELFLPLLDCYLDVYPPRSQEAQYSGNSTDNYCTDSLSGGYRCGDVKRHFGELSMIVSDLCAEAAFIRLYVRSFLSSEDDLRELLSDLRAAMSRYNSRKLRLLEGRVLAGLKDFQRSAEVFDTLLRRGYIGTASTDYLLEHRSMKVYSRVLSAIGEDIQALAVESFAEQCYFTTPIVRCDLCLVTSL